MTEDCNSQQNYPECPIDRYKYMKKHEQQSCFQMNLPEISGLTQKKNVSNETWCINSEYQEDIHWKRGKRLGSGSFGECFVARDLSTGCLMVVKKITLRFNSESELIKVLKSVEVESSLLTKLTTINHPNILRSYGISRRRSDFFIFTEYMPGGSVADLLSQFGQFENPIILFYLRQVLKGLAYLHSNQILHRDLKGANLLVDGTGRHLRISDFGTAARLTEHSTVDGEFRGETEGTIAFMAPEILRNDNYGRSCDIWSVGCIVIEMAIGEPPWKARQYENNFALMYKIANAKHPPDIPQHLTETLRKIAVMCLRMAPNRRPSATQLLHYVVVSGLRVVDSEPLLLHRKQHFHST